MAFPAGLAAACVPQPVLSAAPTCWVGVYSQTAASAVAGKADLALWVAYLAGCQIFTGFAGMAVGPFVRWQHGINMAFLTVPGADLFMSDNADLTGTPGTAV